MKAKTRILIVDDDSVFVDMLKEYLDEYKIEGIDLTVDGVTSSRETLTLVRDKKYDILVLDYLIDEMNGKQIIEEIRLFDKNLNIIVLTGHSDQLPGRDALKNLDIQSYIEKTPLIEDKVVVQIMSIIKAIQHTQVSKKPMDFASMLKELRESHNISQIELAEYCGIKRQQISNYEVGLSRPSLEIAEKMADFFGVSLDYLLCRSKR